MQKTTQFNIRLPKALLYDLEYIADNLKVSRNDWLRVKIAELISQERLRILQGAERDFVYSTISEKEFEKRTGFKPTAEMMNFRKNVSEAPKTYMEGILEKIKK